MKIVFVYVLMFAFIFIGCSDPNLDDPKVREKFLAEAVDEDDLQTRKTPSGEDLRFAPNQEMPYSGWGKEDRNLQQYKNGKPNGVYISWFKNGQNSEKGTYRNGKRNGVWTKWYENGQRDSEGTYKNNVKNGMWSYWNEKGQNFLEIDYSNIDSMVIRLNDSTVREKLLAEAININFLEQHKTPSGDFLVYAPNQEIPYSGWISFSQSACAWYQNGKQNGLFVTWHRRENPQLGTLAFYQDGEREGFYIEWHPNGQKKSELTYKDGYIDGLVIEWHYDGEKRSEGTWKNGIRDGLHTEWNESGQVIQSENYKDGEAQ